MCQSSFFIEPSMSICSLLSCSMLRFCMHATFMWAKLVKTNNIEKQKSYKIMREIQKIDFSQKGILILRPNKSILVQCDTFSQVESSCNMARLAKKRYLVRRGYCGSPCARRDLPRLLTGQCRCERRTFRRLMCLRALTDKSDTST